MHQDQQYYFYQKHLAKGLKQLPSSNEAWEGHTLRSRLKKWGTTQFFQPTFKCLDIWWSTLLSVWYNFSLIILRENQSKCSPNVMIIRITYPNLLHSSDFLCFLFMNYLVNDLRCIFLKLKSVVVFSRYYYNLCH